MPPALERPVASPHHVAMCNTYSLGRPGPDALRASFGAARDEAGNMPELPGIHPQRLAPVLTTPEIRRPLPSLPSMPLQCASTRAAVFVVSTACVTLATAPEIATMFCTTALTAPAASCMLPDISRVTALCSSTAAAVLTT